MEVKLKIGQKISALRRARGHTQEQLAEHLGVTKASVSKWETEQSCPDISLLPRLAAYFGVSIDELVSYEAQLSAGEMKELYEGLIRRFSEEGFEAGMAACKEVVNDYFSCYPMLLKVAVVYLNHTYMAPTPEAAEEATEQVLGLCDRVERYSEDDFDRQQAKSMRALLYLLKGDADRVLRMFGETVRPDIENNGLVAQALFLRGEREKAREITQITAYQSMCKLMNALTALILYTDDCYKVSAIVEKVEALWRVFESFIIMDNALAITYITAAPLMLSQGRYEEGISYIERCAAMASRFENLDIKGNDFFDLIDTWLAENLVTPREQRLVMESFREQVGSNPIFLSYLGEDGSAPEEYKARFAKIREVLENA